MTEFEKLKIAELYAVGNGYKKIAATLGLPHSTVKSFIKRQGKSMAETLATTCLNCGTPIVQLPHRPLRKFCSDKCRSRWWCEHRDWLNRKAIYTHTCQWCGATFENTRKEAKYCNRICYMNAHRKSQPESKEAL